MTSAIALITYRRLSALKETISGLNEHCAKYPTSVWEDCGQRDGTESWLAAGRKPVVVPELMATEYVVDDASKTNTKPDVRVFLGNRNLGVAANSNRAIKWFLDGGWDHLCLMNDDLHVLGDFVNFYAEAHQNLETQFFCFNDFEDESHRWFTVRSRGYGVKIFPRYTGIMMSVTRKIIEKVGYFDVRFGKFGEEHSDWTNRMRFGGGIQLDGQDQPCLDLEHDFLKHQDVETSVTGIDRRKYDAEASTIMREVAKEYHTRHYYRPFALVLPPLAGGNRLSGIPTRNLPGYTVVTDLA